MKILAYLRSLAVAVFHRSQTEHDMEEELRSHVQHRADDLARSGLPPAEAERRARIEFGGRERFKEECREARGWTLIDTLIKDVRFCLRLLRKSPGFTLVALVTLALGIGANAVVFSVVNAFLLHPLNVPQAESLFQIERGKDKAGTFSYPDYTDLRDRNHTFEDLVAYDINEVGLDFGENPTRAWILIVSGNYFDALKIQPHLGRFFHASEQHGSNSAPYIVLSHEYWHSHFHDNPSVVGRTVHLNKHPFTVLGVAPPEFHGTLLFFHPEFYVPMVNREQVQGQNDLNDRAKHWIFMVMGHLKPGVTTTQAISDLNSIGSDLERAYPKDDGDMTFSLASPSLYGDLLGPPVRAFLSGLTLLAGLILLAACANLGGLFAARAADRSREVALRLALGASRRRILRELFTESVLLALGGGAIGVFVSVVLLRQLSGWQPFPRWPAHVPVNPDVNVYATGLLLTFASGLLFGAAPVRQILRTDPYQIVKSGSIGRIGRRMSARDLLLVAQIAICAVLVTSSMVALRGLTRSLHSHFGFVSEHALLVETDLAMADYHGETVPAMQKRIIDSMETIPSAKAIGLIDQLPLFGGRTSTDVYKDDTTDLRPANAAMQALLYRVSPEYFHAAGTALLSGRTFAWHDDKDAPQVAVVNQQFARRIFGSTTNAMGRYYKTRGTRIQIVGIAEDGKYVSLTENPEPVMFLPFLQSPSSGTWLVMRSDQDPQQMAAAVRSTLRSLDPQLPFVLQTWNQEMDNSIVLFAPRMATASLGVLGILGAMLSITGMFGMAAYSVSKRLKELGIRVALGAQRTEVLKAALGRALLLLTLGSITGLLLGVGATKVLSAIVYQATPRDPLVLAGVILLMSLLGLVATWIPAQRALSVDPLKLLREE